MTQLPDNELDERLQRLREYSAHAPASDSLLPRIHEAIEQQRSSMVRMPRTPLGLLAASVLLAAGFVGGRITAPVPPATSAQTQNPALAVQQSGTRLVSALDALSAMKDSAPADVRAQNREVTLVALGAVLAASSSDYPDEVKALLNAAQSRQESPR